MVKKLGTGKETKLAHKPASIAQAKASSPSPAHRSPTEEPSTGVLGLISKAPSERLPRSYRLRPTDLERLKAITQAMNDSSPNRRLTETDVLRGLLMVGEKIPKKQLFDAIREAIV